MYWTWTTRDELNLWRCIDKHFVIIHDVFHSFIYCSPLFTNHIPNKYIWKKSLTVSSQHARSICIGCTIFGRNADSWLTSAQFVQRTYVRARVYVCDGRWCVFVSVKLCFAPILICSLSVKHILQKFRWWSPICCWQKKRREQKNEKQLIRSIRCVSAFRLYFDLQKTVRKIKSPIITYA